MNSPAAGQRHSNPVYEGYFADPFVWKHNAVYYAIGTGEREATGRTGEHVFPVLQSADFFRWKLAGTALERPDRSFGDCYWAPAIASANNRFYLYYSAGHGDKHHQLRVASSHSPSGPYQDLQTPLSRLETCPFAIDPHPFKDDDGQWYLFYARDFLDVGDNARAGTALVVTPMRTFTALAPDEHVVLRAHYDWQRFQSPRQMYGRSWDWHTLEGPCVHKYQGRYYCFYSGGRWENETYGVDYAVADHVLGPYTEAGNERGPRVLRTSPGRVVGPGHNTVVVGPDEKTTYIVYHAWDPGMTARRMYINRLWWTPDGPRCEDHAAVSPLHSRATG